MINSPSAAGSKIELVNYTKAGTGTMPVVAAAKHFDMSSNWSNEYKLWSCFICQTNRITRYFYSSCPVQFFLFITGEKFGTKYILRIIYSLFAYIFIKNRCNSWRVKKLRLQHFFIVLRNTRMVCKRHRTPDCHLISSSSSGFFWESECLPFLILPGRVF